jgi:hypothetical protein
MQEFEVLYSAILGLGILGLLIGFFFGVAAATVKVLWKLAPIVFLVFLVVYLTNLIGA